MAGDPPAAVGPVVRTLVDAVAQLPELVSAASAAGDPGAALRDVLRTHVHDVVVRATADASTGRPAELEALAEIVQGQVQAGAEDGLNPRSAVFVRLLRRRALEPAWLLAQDNAAGVVQASQTVSTWAGGSTPTTRLPLPTVVDAEGSGRVFAWLPGFRDPRFGQPDDVYDITDRVVLRSELDYVAFRDGALHLSGTAYLGQLVAGPDDRVTLRWSGPPGAADVVVAGVRGRRPDLVQARGPELTRLAWGGWSAAVDLAALAAHRGKWRAVLELEQQGVRRTGPLGTRRGALAASELLGEPTTVHDRTMRIEPGEPRRGLCVVVQRPVDVLGWSARRTLGRVARVVRR